MGPPDSLASSRFFLRKVCMAVASKVEFKVNWAVLARDSIMRSAINLRTPLTGSTSAPSIAPGSSMSPAKAMPAKPLPRAGGSKPPLRAAAEAEALSRGRPARTASTSRSITRPPGPVPGMVSGSIPERRASLRARGLTPASEPPPDDVATGASG